MSHEDIASPTVPAPSAAGARAPLVTRLREVHGAMIAGVLAGEGLLPVAELAARAVGAPVVVVVPRLGVAFAAPGAEVPSTRLEALEAYVADRARERPTRVPDGLLAEVPVVSAGATVGTVVALAADHPAAPDPDAPEFLHLAAVAALTEVALAEAREEVEQNLRGSLVEDLRSRADLEPAEAVRRAARLGCDLSAGVVVLCAELTTDRPRHVAATIAGEHAGALVQHLEPAAGAAQAGRVYALLPAVGDAESTLAAARGLATRLERHGTVGISSFYADPEELRRAVAEAELVLDVLRQSDGSAGFNSEDMGSGTYRLLFRVLASHPEEVRSFYEDTVAPLVAYDVQYGTDLVGTLEAYLDHDCNMNATAAAIFAHRHTVAYRLDRARDLAGLDPMRTEDRERLGLGLKAYRIIAPRLPR